MNKKIIAFVGMPGAGKSSCVEFLERKGWQVIYFGQITLDEVKSRGQEINEINERSARESIRAKEGMGAYATRMIPKIEEAPENKNIVIDGLYSWSEYKILKEKYADNIIVVAIAAPRNSRHQRLSSRPTRPLAKDVVSKREYDEIENIEKGGPIANADFTIINDSSEEELIENLEKLLNLLEDVKE